MYPVELTQEQPFEIIKKKAPLLNDSHPLAYLTVPQSSILDPYRNDPYFFPTKRMVEGQYKPYGGGFYATEFLHQSRIEGKEFQIGVRIGRL